MQLSANGSCSSPRARTRRGRRVPAQVGLHLGRQLDRFGLEHHRNDFRQTVQDTAIVVQDRQQADVLFDFSRAIFVPDLAWARSGAGFRRRRGEHRVLDRTARGLPRTTFPNHDEHASEQQERTAARRAQVRILARSAHEAVGSIPSALVARHIRPCVTPASTSRRHDEHHADGASRATSIQGSMELPCREAGTACSSRAAEDHRHQPGAAMHVADGPVGVVAERVHRLDRHHRALERLDHVEGSPTIRKLQDRVRAQLVPDARQGEDAVHRAAPDGRQQHDREHHASDCAQSGQRGAEQVVRAGPDVDGKISAQKCTIDSRYE